MNTVNISSRQSSIYRPKDAIMAIVIIIFLWFLLKDALVVLVILAITALFLIGLKKPLWVLVALLVSQLTLTTYMVPTPLVAVSFRLLLLVITLLIMSKALILREIDLGPKSKKLVKPIWMLIALVVLSDIVNAAGFDFAFREFRDFFTGLLFVILLPAIIQNVKQLRIVCSITLTVIIASAIIGIFQHYNIFGMGQATLVPGLVDRLGRVPGISETDLELSYILSVTLMILLGMYVKKGINSKNRSLLIIAGVLILGGLYFTYTRSAILSVAVGAISVLLFMKIRTRWQLVLVITFVLFLLLEATSISGQTFLGGRSESEQEESAIARPILWQAGTAIAIDNPILGIGGAQFRTLSVLYESSVDPALIEWEDDRYWSFRTLGTYAPHNDFLKIWVYYGTFAVIIFIWLHFVILRNCCDAFRKSKTRFIKGLSLGLAGALIAYVVNSFYHNLTATLPLIWILAGFSLVITKLAAKDNLAKT